MSNPEDQAPGNTANRFCHGASVPELRGRSVRYLPTVHSNGSSAVRSYLIIVLAFCINYGLVKKQQCREYQ